MNDLFWRIVNISISASWLILAVVILRLVLKKAPKVLHVTMWALVALRLICPVTIESELSLVPQQKISQQAIESWAVEIDTPTASFDVPSEYQEQQVQMQDTPVFKPSDSALPHTNDHTPVIPPAADTKAPAKHWNVLDSLPLAWAVGILLMALYGVFGYLRLGQKLRTAVIREKNIYCTEHPIAPFVFGIFNPKIYIPFNMRMQDVGYVVAHERVHIQRKDHWWKPLAYLLLSVYWFNPLMWLAFILLCRDIELACDEQVVKQLDAEQRADYSQALLSCSTHRSRVLTCPVAFGETGVGDRIKKVLSYKKPAVWISVVAVLAIVVCGICFMTAQPAEATEHGNTLSNQVSGDPAKNEHLSKPNSETVDNDEPVIQYFPNGVAYSIKSLDVKSSYISLEIMAYLKNGEQLQMYHIPYYWLEEKTDAGWDPLPVKNPEVQGSQTMIHLTGYTNPNTEAKGCDYVWSAEWNDLYGLLPVGNYRIGIRVTEDAEPYYVEFSLEESNNEQISEELEYCRQAVQKILDSNYYQVMIHQRSELLSIAPNSGNEHLLGNPTVMYDTIIKSGENYLYYAQNDHNDFDNPRDGSMKKDGVTYRLDNVVEWDVTSGIGGWSVWTEPRQDLFTWWADCFALNAEQIDDIHAEGSTITFCTAEGPESERTETEYVFTLDENGNLEKMCRTARMNNYNGAEAEHISVFEVTILSVNDPQVSTWIDEQDVNFYRDFSWNADVNKYDLSGTVQEENTSTQSITTAPEAIAAAEKYSDNNHTKIEVYRDATTNMWKVEFQRNYGARGYLYIYLDDPGNYYGSAEGERRT